MDRLSRRQYKDVAMKKVFVVRLTEAERLELDAMVRKGKGSALSIARARILLKADQGKEGPAQTDSQVAEALSVAAKTVFNVRRRWVEEGLEAALRRKKQDRPSRLRKLDGAAEAELVATCCGPVPKGGHDGRCGCLPASWSSWRRCLPSARKQYAAR